MRPFVQRASTGKGDLACSCRSRLVGPTINITNGSDSDEYDTFVAAHGDMAHSDDRILSPANDKVWFPSCTLRLTLLLGKRLPASRCWRKFFQSPFMHLRSFGERSQLPSLIACFAATAICRQWT
jgi:hypothetical protein